jgi:hypothetical protein
MHRIWVFLDKYSKNTGNRPFKKERI